MLWFDILMGERNEKKYHWVICFYLPRACLIKVESEALVSNRRLSRLINCILEKVDILSVTSATKNRMPQPSEFRCDALPIELYWNSDGRALRIVQRLRISLIWYIYQFWYTRQFLTLTSYLRRKSRWTFNLSRRTALPNGRFPKYGQLNGITESLAFNFDKTCSREKLHWLSRSITRGQRQENY